MHFDNVPANPAWDQALESALDVWLARIPNPDAPANPGAEMGGQPVRSARDLVRQVHERTPQGIAYLSLLRAAAAEVGLDQLVSDLRGPAAAAPERGIG